MELTLLRAQDPNESAEKGWTDAGHYVTGCSKDWISLRLVGENGEDAKGEKDFDVVDGEGENEVPDALKVEGKNKNNAASPVGNNIVHSIIAAVFAGLTNGVLV